MDLSENPLRSDGMAEIAEAVRRSHSIITLKLRQCLASEDAITSLKQRLSENTAITDMDVSGNKIPERLRLAVEAEAEANHLLQAIEDRPLEVDISVLRRQV